MNLQAATGCKSYWKPLIIKSYKDIVSQPKSLTKSSTYAIEVDALKMILEIPAIILFELV